MTTTKVLALRWEGQLVRFDDLLGTEAEELEDKLGVPYVEIRVGSHMKHRMATLAIWLRRTKSEAEVAKLLGSLTVADWDRMLEIVEVDLPVMWEDGVPLGDEASTPT